MTKLVGETCQNMWLVEWCKADAGQLTNGNQADWIGRASVFLSLPYTVSTEIDFTKAIFTLARGPC